MGCLENKLESSENNLENNGKQTQTYSLILAMQRCTGHDSGKLHFKKCYCRCVLLLMTTAVMLLHSCCCHFCIFCCLFCFSSPSSFGYSKQARRHAKQWERFRGWKRLKKREHEGWRGIEKARLPYRRQSLSNKTHGKKKRTWRPWGREDVRTCQNRLALRYYSDMPSTSDRTSERSYQTLWKVLTFFVEDFVALMCQSWLSYLLQKTSAA